MVVGAPLGVNDVETICKRCLLTSKLAQYVGMGSHLKEVATSSFPALIPGGLPTTVYPGTWSPGRELFLWAWHTNRTVSKIPYQGRE